MADGAARFRVHITPRAGGNAITGWRDGMLWVRVSAPPVEGRANAALETLIARALSLPKSRVHVVAGAALRLKTVEIEGLSAEALAGALARAGGF